MCTPCMTHVWHVQLPLLLSSAILLSHHLGSNFSQHWQPAMSDSCERAVAAAAEQEPAGHTQDDPDRADPGH